MDIFLGVLGVIIVILLIILIFRKPFGASSDFKSMEERLIRMEGQVKEINPSIDRNFRENRKEIAENLERLQTGNEKKLEEMRITVDEKLQKSVERRFDESFKTLSRQLTQVTEGIGEVKSLTNDVGDLKKVMEGVKTRGIYGEVQLSAIISDMLNSNQYDENIITKNGSNDRVEFAVKMPGQGDGVVYLPIDSKFPIENYSRLISAYDDGDKTDILKYQKALSNDVKEQAKKISSKYLDPPHTTTFAIMFVPTESLYAEIMRIPGLYDEVRQKYFVTIVSPSTLPVILSSLKYGFKTLAISERTGDIMLKLSAVKTQFGKFGDILEAVQKKLQESAQKIDSAKTSSRRIEKQLSDVDKIDESESVKLIGEI